MSAVVLVAKGELGYLETGDNDTKYGKWYGLNNQHYNRCVLMTQRFFITTTNFRRREDFLFFLN